ncbi:YqaA family protein [Desulfuromonas carbonis]|uniref:YqaA family protein n=1 Tax=Desulfuromonas sp. DDH964 TaxID=1823759 RepID=UPI00078E4BA1|nr:VTT domain-containing protein [Desulfuromonas sp. DDH964]AMV72205.1 membrane protein DedA [Desulfuromonas sp. DDH964]
MRLLRRLYDWVLHWANTPYGAPALFLLALAEASFFPIPPDVLLLALCLSVPARAYRFALVAAAGSVLGGILGYGIGQLLWDLLAPIFYTYVPGFTEDIFLRVQQLFATYDFWTVFVAGFTPIPYKVITIGAGVFRINFGIFVFASLLSRSLRFFLVAWLLHRYGASMRLFIERYFNLLTLGFAVLLIGGFLLVKLFY